MPELLILTGGGPNREMDAVSSQLLDFVLLALDHAMNSVIASGGPLTPFLLTQQDDEGGRLTRFLCDSLEEGVAQARSRAREVQGICRAAIAWDGYLTQDGTRTDAIFVEASEAGAAQSIIVAQRYVAGLDVHRLGEVVLAGEGKPLF